MNRNETAAALALMAVVWDHITVDDNTITAWHWALEDYPYELVEPELKRWVRTHRFPPKPAEIREQIAEATVHLPTPEAAWGMVLDRLSWPSLPSGSQGRYWDVPEEVRAALRQVGTINNLRQSEMQAADRKTFIAAYTAIRDRAVESVTSGERPPALRRIAPGVFGNDAAIRAFPQALDAVQPRPVAIATGQER